MSMAMCKLALFSSALLLTVQAVAKPVKSKKAQLPAIGILTQEKPSLLVPQTPKAVARRNTRKPVLPPSVIAREKMEEARGAYERGDYDRAARAYEAVPVSEPEYLRTREELAWSYLRGEEWSRLRGILPHLNSKLVPMRWRLEGRVLSAMMYLRDCQYEEVKNDIEMFQYEMAGLSRKLEAKARSGRNAHYWNALRNEVEEAVFKMKFVKVELRSRLVLLTRDQMHEGRPVETNKGERIAANALVYPVDREFWADELFKARGEGRSSCAAVHKPTKEKVTQ